MAQEIAYSSLQLAFFGDAVYELFVREHVLKTVSGHVEKLNRYSKTFSMAVTQAKIADFLLAGEFLSEEEAAVFRRGRNAKSASVPKSCTPTQYRRATGLEALMGWLFLSGKEERAKELFTLGLAYVTELEENL